MSAAPAADANATSATAPKSDCFSILMNPLSSRLTRKALSGWNRANAIIIRSDDLQSHSPVVDPQRFDQGRCWVITALSLCYIILPRNTSGANAARDIVLSDCESFPRFTSSQ